MRWKKKNMMKLQCIIDNLLYYSNSGKEEKKHCKRSSYEHEIYITDKAPQNHYENKLCIVLGKVTARTHLFVLS